MNNNSLLPPGACVNLRGIVGRTPELNTNDAQPCANGESGDISGARTRDFQRDRLVL